MAKNKTVETSGSVATFINAISDKTKRDDCVRIIEVFEKQTKLPPKMWGSAIVGFGTYHYKYESGREGDMPLVAFSPRKNAIVFYLSANFEKRDELLKKFGKHTTGKGCIYIKQLVDIDIEILKKIVSASAKRNIAQNLKK